MPRRRRIAANINAYDKTRPVTRVGKVAHATSKASKPPPGWPPTYDESQHANLLAESQIPMRCWEPARFRKRPWQQRRRRRSGYHSRRSWRRCGRWRMCIRSIKRARGSTRRRRLRRQAAACYSTTIPLDLFPTTAAAAIDVSEEDDALLRLGGSPSRVPAHPPPAPSPVPPPPLEPPPIEAWKSPDPPPRAAKHSMLSQKAWMRRRRWRRVAHYAHHHSRG